MGKKLTDKQWQKIKPPFHYLRITHDLSSLQLDFIDKWLTANITGWWYGRSEDKTKQLYVFQYETDMTFFKLWSINNPFEEDSGAIT